MQLILNQLMSVILGQKMWLRKNLKQKTANLVCSFFYVVGNIAFGGNLFTS